LASNPIAPHNLNSLRFVWSDKAPSTELQVANRDLGTVEHVNSNGDLRIRMDSGKEVRFNVREHPHLDYGYAVTGHSSQGRTADQVLIHALFN
jgi:ATP-dependent exoDNAse (exonuclease V) alpha subunit